VAVLLSCVVLAMTDHGHSSHRPHHGHGSHHKHAPKHHAPVHHAPVHHAPKHHAPAPSYHAPAPSHHKPTYEEKAHPYEYTYAVKDDYTGNDFGHKETSNGDGTVSGSYRVLLPDGRTQIVTYTADHYNGYQAEVHYEGEAHYSEHTPSYKAPAPSYHAPAPSYHAPDPSYHAPAPSYH
ncbi:unnamed protein product, partial [Meganyctiphanes norvegica]